MNLRKKADIHFEESFITKILCREIHRALSEQVNKNKNIEVRTNQYAINLIKKGRCVAFTFTMLIPKEYTA